MTSTAVYADIVAPQKLGKKDWYKHEGLGGVTTDEHVIPITGDTLYIAAHADVLNAENEEETAWAQGKCRKLKLQFVFPDISEEELGFNLFPGTGGMNDWPTNAYQGDYVTFDIEYSLEDP